MASDVHMPTLLIGIFKQKRVFAGLFQIYCNIHGVFSVDGLLLGPFPSNRSIVQQRSTAQLEVFLLDATAMCKAQAPLPLQLVA